MEMAEETPASVISRAEEVLQTAKLGLDDLRLGNRPRKSSGLKNLIVWGRAFTNVLERLRGFRNLAFDDWYAKYENEMRNDELMRFFYNLRSRVLKEGEPLPVKTGFIVKGPFTFPKDLERFGPKPKGTTGAFIDANGAGWTVATVNGMELKYYVPLPRQVANPFMDFAEPPQTHLGISLKGKSLEELAEMYLGYLSRMLEDAKREFGKV
jgi:hypothetical protein